MASHAGIFFFDGRPVGARGTWAAVAPGLAIRQDPELVWTASLPARGLTGSSSGLTIAWDGRLDNRDDLLLQIGGALSARATDAEIALAVFDRRGVDGFKDLVGDWSAAVWDGRTRRLHLARDYMGLRPLYYYVGPRSVSWSSRLAELVGQCGCADRLNEAFVAGYMTLRPSPEATPYENLRAVPAATCVSFDAGGAVARRTYWRLEPALVRYPDPRTYEEQLRLLWREAVASRLRTSGAVWAELSGGLDSSSVVCMADRLVKDGAVGARGIRPVSHATLRSPEGDERRFIAEVERQIGVRSQIVGVEDSQDLIDDTWDWVSPYALRGVGLASVQCVREGGGRLVLSGRMGDAVMGGQPDNSAALFDDLAERRLGAALANLRAWSRATRKPAVEIAAHLFFPEKSRQPDPGVALLTPRLRRFVEGEDPCRDPAPRVRRAKRQLARMVLGYSRGARFDVPVLPPDVVYAYPFCHRPLVEFALAIPGGELGAPGATRSLMRRAFAGLLPSRVLRRTSKGYYPPAAFRAVREASASLANVDRMEVVQRGWIDAARLRDAIRVLTDGSGATGGDIHCVLRLEGWLQSRQRRLRTPDGEEVSVHAVLNA